MSSIRLAVTFKQLHENISNMTDVEIKMAESRLDWSNILLHLAVIGLPFGHFTGMIPTGILADAFTAKWVFFWGVATSSAVTIIVPLALYRIGYLTLFFLRVLVGMSQSAMFPCVSKLFACWIPRTERSIVGGILFSSYPLCVILSYFISYLVRPTSRLWANSFYFWGALGALWCVFVRFFIYDYPPAHPRITNEEENYLNDKVPRKIHMVIPLRKIFLDDRVWTLLLGQVGVNFTIHMMLWDVPWQLRDGLGWTMEFANIVVVPAFLGLTFTSIISGIIIYYGLIKWKWDLKWTRRIASLFYVIPNVFICIQLYQTLEYIDVASFVIAAISLGPYYASFKVSHLDITINFPGTVFAIITTISETVGFISFVVLKNIRSITYERYCKINAWLAFVLTFSTISYYFGRVRVDRAPWDIPPHEADQYQEGLNRTQANSAGREKVT
ncbi:membrane transporter [Oryctes borbonicus]|uniref:Membrane transporter n=1 Tax=Oryctes borbonicus TaxID=1629725 RepID=A0A0T6AVZ2_9SCAR|nr:membrane transporter [Oryctes borbonicus]